MVPGLMGVKLGMTRLFLDEGLAIPVTVLKVGPCRVVQKKQEAKDGYNAVQLGFAPKKEKRVNKPLQGHFSAAGVEPLAHLREFRVEDPNEFDLGQVLDVSMFQPGELVKITGTSKGKGFAGVIKRHGLSGGKATHGCKTHRSPGSIGASAFPSRVVKGRKMPGHAGNRKATVKNLRIMDVRPDEHLMLVQGAVPGAPNGLVIVRKTEL